MAERFNDCKAGEPLPRTGPCKRCGAERNEICRVAAREDAQIADRVRRWWDSDERNETLIQDLWVLLGNRPKKRGLA